MLDGGPLVTLLRTNVWACIPNSKLPIFSVSSGRLEAEKLSYCFSYVSNLTFNLFTDCGERFAWILICIVPRVILGWYLLRAKYVLGSVSLLPSETDCNSIVSLVWSMCDRSNGIQFKIHCCFRTSWHPIFGTQHRNLDDSWHLVKYLSSDDRNAISTAMYNIIKFKIEEFSFTMSKSGSSVTRLKLTLFNRILHLFFGLQIILNSAKILFYALQTTIITPNKYGIKFSNMINAIQSHIVVHFITFLTQKSRSFKCH